MVAVCTSMAWQIGFRKRILFRHEKPPSSPTLEVLAFETAKTMSRLIGMYKSLSDDEFFKLRKGPMKSLGVVYLNSDDESYLLGLACKEKLEDLDQAANVVSRLDQKCVAEELNRFQIVYHNMKQGIIDASGLDYGSRNVEKIIEKMEKYTNATSNLHAALAALNELEVSEKKMQKWNKNVCHKKPTEEGQKTNLDYFNDKLSFQRKQVRYFRQISLWNKTFDESVELMARIVCVLYTRICTIFRPFVPSLPRIINKRQFNTRLHFTNTKPLQVKVHPQANYSSKSGPIMKTSENNPKPTLFYSGKLSPEDKGFGVSISTVTFSDKFCGIINNTGIRNQRLVQSAPENTVGAAGLAIRYANVIAMAESYFYSTTLISDEARQYMFDMLPLSLKQTLRVKLKGQWSKDGGERERHQRDLAEGWREALEEIIEWLAPMAHDTLTWQQERNLEHQKLDAKPSVLLFQTLHFSDLEKTEAAIVEVLVGLSCIYTYENRREKSHGFGNKGTKNVGR